MSTINVRIHRRGPAFGDLLLAAHTTVILNDNGIVAVLDEQREEMLQNIVAPLWNGAEDWPEWRFTYTPEMRWDGRSILRKALDNFASAHGLTEPLRITRGNIATRFRTNNDVPTVDVAIASRVGYWSPWREWPYFPELKAQLTRAGLTWCDVSESGVKGDACLELVSRARLYLGVETGTSHFVSSVARRALIIQSGYSDIDYWSWYGYSYLHCPVECTRCFLTHANNCPSGHRCMTQISVEHVFAALRLELARDERSEVRGPTPNRRVVLPDVGAEAPGTTFSRDGAVACPM